MSKPLQDFSALRSAYERPNHPYRCGRDPEGRACPVGPSARGRCAEAECQPVTLDDGSQRCGRPKSYGGACSSGPVEGKCGQSIPRCQPTMHHRKKRGLLTFGVTAATVGLVMAAFSDKDVREAVIKPGPVTTNHVKVAEKCQSCHAAADAGASGWMAAWLDEGRVLADSERCQSCHNFGDHGLNAHAQAPKQLVGLRGEAQANTVSAASWALSTAAALDPVASSVAEPFACGGCHREHQGREHDLTAMSNQRCQACHTTKFESMADGHPAFDDFGEVLPQGVAFTHRSHLNGRFGELGQDCSMCHFPDEKGMNMHAEGYEQTCASCHDADFQDSNPDPNQAPGVELVLWKFPDLALDRLGEDFTATMDGVGGWPSSDQADAQISTFMRVLLMGDLELVQALPDLRPPDLFSYHCEGSAARPNCDYTIQFDPNGPEPEDWEFECPDCYDAGTDPAPRVVRDADPKVLALYAQAIKRGFLELAGAAEGDAEAQHALKQRFDRAAGRFIPLETVENFVAVLPGPALTGLRDAWFPGESAALEGPPEALLPPSRPLKHVCPRCQAEVFIEPGPFTEDWEYECADCIDEGVDPAPRVELADAPKPEKLSAPLVLLGGTWYKTPGMAVTYRIGGHADPLVRAWLELASEMPSSSPAVERGLEAIQLASCTKCHTVNRTGQIARVQFLPSFRTGERSFTDFSHTPHTNFPEISDCSSCHELREPKETAPELSDFRMVGPTAEDADWFAVEVEEGTYHVRVETSQDTVLGLYDAQGELLAENDDVGGGDRGSLVEWTSESAQTVYVKVTGYDQRAATYRLRVERLEGLALELREVTYPSADQHADTEDGATPLVLEADRRGVTNEDGLVEWQDVGSVPPAVGVIQFGDVDVFSARVPTDGAYVFRTISGGDTVLKLFSADGHLLAENDDDLAGGGLHSRIEWTPESDEDVVEVYVRVEGKRFRTPSYALVWEYAELSPRPQASVAVTPAEDAYGDTREEASWIDVGEFVQGRIQTTEDAGTYTMEVSEGEDLLHHYYGTQQGCASCHTAERAGDSCLTCHNYHVGRFPPIKEPNW